VADGKPPRHPCISAADPSIERSFEDGNRGHKHQNRKGQHLLAKVSDIGTFEHDAANDPNEMCERQALADFGRNPACPLMET
jgi:hypothetical protein